jgi:glucose-6-phosphate isomerase
MTAQTAQKKNSIPVSALSSSPLWQDLQKHAKTLEGVTLPQLFAEDKARFQQLSFHLPGMLVDFSKNKVTGDTLRLLLRFAQERKVENRRHDMFSGAKINNTEGRAVLHAALRAPKDKKITVDGKDVVPDVHHVLERMAHFANAVRHGHWRGHSGKEITDIVNIGIGGSSLGPQFATEAMCGFHHMRLKAHFVANVEASDLQHVLQKLSPETTLFIIASKTFTTQETMQNARVAREKVLKHYNNDEKAVEKHFVALSTNAAEVGKFGILPENMFPFWDWVGGRYSVWSAIGLSVMLMIGPDHFAEFLKGAREMDEHFQTAPLDKNIPVLMALIGLWHRNMLGLPAYAVIPYHSALKRLPAWLQQADMESNGKSVNADGEALEVPTGPVIFGEPGTDAQHSFFQWLHQGTDIVPVDFIAAVRTPYGTKAQQNMLLANLLAQSEALMNGQSIEGQPQRFFPGSRPSTTILLDELNPRTLGMLMALYEHKVFVQGALWGVNSFDQFGVELGKVLAKTLEAELNAKTEGKHDSSTAGLMKYIHDHGV